MRNWLGDLAAARLNRATYGTYTILYLIVYAVFGVTIPSFPRDLLLPPLWIMLIAMPRLRDIGWSIWWSIAPFGAGFFTGILRSIERAARGLQPGAAGPSAQMLSVLVAYGALAFMVLIGVKKGRPETAVEVFS